MIAELDNNGLKRTSSCFSLPACRLIQCWTDRLSWGYRRSGFIAVSLLLGLFVAPSPASACLCAPLPFPTIEEAATTSDVAILGRVVRRGSRDGRPPKSSANAAYLDIEVLESMRGPEVGITLRVWDALSGTDCARFMSFPAGSVLVLALERYEEPDREGFLLSRIQVRKGDYLLKTCGEYVRQTSSLEEAAPLVKSIRARLRRGK